MSGSEYQSGIDSVVRIGGEGGDGVISCGELLALAVARTEYHVFTCISYPAGIRGGLSMIQVRVMEFVSFEDMTAL